jgi:hypothetical protein
MRQMRAKGERNERFVRRYTKFLAIPFVLTILTLPPWMPAEELHIIGARPVAAYVLSDSGADLTVLLVTTRQIEYIDRSLVVSRTLCNDGTIAPASEPLPAFLPPHQSYPDCLLRP